ncbi:MAG: SpoIIIAH-like family protein [Firmicutes bacterium]|nr:SpoIIIAH-like family protein [Bacillota bacterium]
MKKALWIIALVVLAGITYVLVSGLHLEMKNIEVIGGEKEKEEEKEDTDLLSKLEENIDLEIDDTAAFFAEYRMERGRVRAQEKELLEELINNGKASESSRREAEERLLALVELMEKELLLENMIKAQGFEDALFFYREGRATVMVRSEGMSEVETALVVDAASGVVGVEPEAVQVLMRY